MNCLVEVRTYCKQQEQLTDIVGFFWLKNTGLLALLDFTSCTKRRLKRRMYMGN